MNAGPVPGATFRPDGRVRFSVWAPWHERMALVLLDPSERLVPMERHETGHHVVDVAGVQAGHRYRYRMPDGTDRPDPASRSQPEGVHGPSAVVDRAFAWSDAGWRGITADDLVLYELHVGTFTPEGTFAAAARQVERLATLGVTAVELLPISQFPGRRNWGYDGVFPYAAHGSYGGPDGLRQFVDACHGAGLGVLLDVVYNHLGPEGNVLGEFGPYFTHRYATPWGDALNFDGPESSEVRRFFVESALMWVSDFHVDGFRLDAVHAIVDASPVPFVEELAAAVHRQARDLGRSVLVTAESADNDPRLTRDRALGGMGLDAQWNDDFHHGVHVATTGEQREYYADFDGVSDVGRCLRHGFSFGGRRSPSRRRRIGRPPHWPAGGVSLERLVAFVQNHDQVGNRPYGDRLSTLVPLEAYKAALGLLLLSPFVPLLFMGDEYGETAPFQYFVDHSDPDLVEAVRRGRQAEFSGFDWSVEGVPDPQDEATFLRSRLDVDLASDVPHSLVLGLTGTLLGMRRELRHPLGAGDPVEVSEAETGLVMVRPHATVPSVVGVNLGGAAVDIPVPPGTWSRRVDSSDERWGGPGSESPEEVKSRDGETVSVVPWSFVVYTRSEG